MTYTFSQALQEFKTEVNIKYPPGAIQTRRVQELTKGRGGHGRRKDCVRDRQEEEDLDAVEEA